MIGLTGVTAGGERWGKFVTVETCGIPCGSGQLHALGPQMPTYKGSVEIAMLAVKLRLRRLAVMMGVDPDKAKGFIDLWKNDVDINALTVPGDVVPDGGSGGLGGAALSFTLQQASNLSRQRTRIRGLSVAPAF